QADPEVRPCPDRRQAHAEVDEEERNERHQPQREEIERAILLEAAIEILQSIGESVLHPVSEQEARGKKRQRRADGCRQKCNAGAEESAEDRTGDQGEHPGGGNRECRHDRIKGKEDCYSQEEILAGPRLEIVNMCSHAVPGEVVLQAEKIESA